MSTSPLEQPRDVYRPFSKRESDILRGFVASARRLGGMRFFEQVPTKAAVTMGGPNPGSRMDEPDDQDLGAALPQLRQLYADGEAYFFRKAMSVLKRSVHERNGPLRDEAMDELEQHVQSEKETLDHGIGLGIVFEEQGREPDTIDVRRILNAYFHGRYIHTGGPEEELVRRLDDLAPWGRYTLYTVMNRLMQVYWVGANVVDQVLAVPELLDADVSQPTP